VSAKVAVTGLDKLKRNFDQLGKRYGKEIAKAAFAGGQLVRSDAIKSIQEKSPGQQVTRYRNGGGKYSHTAAGEGEAPNTDTGRLIGSIQVEMKGESGPFRPAEVIVGSTLPYAGWLENGTKYMGERPWLHPAFEKNKPQIRKMIAQAVNKVTDKEGNFE
jgi:HK97 gp10 family phage protein